MQKAEVLKTAEGIFIKEFCACLLKRLTKTIFKSKIK